jgi:hypothetical protein
VSLDAQLLDFAACFQSVYGGRASVDGYHRFQLLPPVEQYLLSNRTAIVCHDPALLAEFLAHSKQVIDLTIYDDKNDDDDDDDDDDDAHVSWLGNPRTAQYRVRLIPPSLINCFQIADHLPSPSTALLAKFTHTRCRPQKRHLTAATHGGKHYPWKNVPTWSPLCCKYDL